MNALLGSKYLIGNKAFKLWLVKRYDNGLMRLLYESLYESFPLSVTLTTRKVYVGYVFEVPRDSPHDQYLTMMLLLSGYRDEKTLSLCQTLNYAQRTNLESTPPIFFLVAFSVDQIVTANRFDLALYEHEFQTKLVAEG